MKKMMKYFMLIILLAAVAIGFFAYNYVYKRNTGFDEKSKLIYIHTGANFSDVVNELKSQHIIKDVNAFEWLSKKKKYINKVRPGCYKITKGMTNEAIVNLLRSGIQQPVEVKFNNLRIPSQLAGAVAGQIEADSLSLYKMLVDENVAKSYGFNVNSFIAMYVPNTYEFYWNTSAEGFVKRMAKEYKSFWNISRKAKAKKWNLTESEITTLASIVEEETKMATDKPIVAGVYLNRLKKNIPLEADPTLKFALQDFTIKRILNVDKEVVSPYNTYKNQGLPPGPICIPDVSTIDAVLNATEHEYIFFCAKEDFSGYSNFAVTNAEHEVNAKKYQQALNKMNIKR
jgi:UPF0755 protein